MFDEQSIFILAEGITFTEIEENGKKEIVFYHGENEHYYSLNAMASEIFLLLMEGKNIGEVIDYIMNNFKVANRDLVKNDVEDLVKDLLEEKILEKSV